MTIAGIHESVANQKRNPFRNHLLKLVFASRLRESHSSGASAKSESTISPIGGNDAHRRNPGSSQNTFTSFFMKSVTIYPPICVSPLVLLGFVVVVGSGFEPLKALASRFTVCPR